MSIKMEICSKIKNFHALGIFSIREKHLTDSTTAEVPYTADEVQKKIDEVMNFKGSERGSSCFWFAISCKFRTIL